MTKDDIQLLCEYDRWANHRALEAASTLSEEQFTRDLGGSFRSVRDTLVHMIGGGWILLNYWKKPIPDAAFRTELRQRREALFQPNGFPSVATVRVKWEEVEREQIEFVDTLTDEALTRPFPLRNNHVSLAHLMQHLANHSTYHRGQIALMMRQLHGVPLATDFHVFLIEGRREGTQ